ALRRRVEEFAGDLIEPFERIGRLYHELDRQAETARQRRRLKCDDAGAGNLAQLLLERRLQLVGRQLALVPRRENVPADILPLKVKLEDMRGFRMLLEDFEDLPSIHQPLLERRIR